MGRPFPGSGSRSLADASTPLSKILYFKSTSNNLWLDNIILQLVILLRKLMTRGGKEKAEAWTGYLLGVVV
jgi:hypothetical protein